MIFFEENTLKKIVMAAPSAALFPKHAVSPLRKKQKMFVFMEYVIRPKLTFVSFLCFFCTIPLRDSSKINELESESNMFA